MALGVVTTTGEGVPSRNGLPHLQVPLPRASLQVQQPCPEFLFAQNLVIQFPYSKPFQDHNTPQKGCDQK